VNRLADGGRKIPLNARCRPPVRSGTLPLRKLGQFTGCQTRSRWRGARKVDGIGVTPKGVAGDMFEDCDVGHFDVLQPVVILMLRVEATPQARNIEGRVMARIEAFVNWTMFALAVSAFIGLATASAPW
jgi:hypothetical protein